MSRPQDSIIDDDEESCPLCIEEFDLTDKNFKPCPCGYQICQFCFNSLKTTYEKSTCPNCRRVYDEKTIQFKIPSKEDIVNDKENKARKQAATKRKEVEKREVETSNRRNLAGVRVKQQNLVYVIGLVPSVKDESTLLQTLRGPQYFGQYGEIDKIVVSKAKPGATSQGIGVYITYATKEAAALCIEVVDGSMNGDRVLRAQYGTTKYCSAYLRGENCNNKSCTFLHETGEEGHGTTLQNEPSHSKPANRPSCAPQPAHAQSAVRPSQSATIPIPAASSQLMRRENSKDDAKDRTNDLDASALPSTASWASKDASTHPTKNRRASQTGGRSSTSPQVSNAAPSLRKGDEIARPESTASTQAPEAPGPSNASKPQSSVENPQSRPTSSGRTSPRSASAQPSLFDKIVANINSPEFRFSFDEKAFTSEELAALERCPTMIDPYGGAKRRLMREKEAERLRQQIENQAKLEGRPASAGAAEEENVESGSLALGGEPEEGTRVLSAGSAIQRPNQSSHTSSSLNGQFASLGINSRSLTPQQRQQLALLSSSNTQKAPGLGQQNFGLSAFDDQRQNSFPNQQYDPTHGHARQSSRYSFANDSVKPNPTPRLPAQQQPSPAPQHFYTGGVQGPPPGLKTAGTPPISGGGMFAQGHGFTSNMNAGFGAAKDTNTDMLMRGRSGTGSGHDISKRGGVVDLADPSILQARLHPNAGGAGQGLFGGQNQVDQDFPPLAPPTKLREGLPPSRPQLQSIHGSLDYPVRSSTPRVPPGLSLPHAHPLPSFSEETETKKNEPKASSSITGPVTPALPVLPIGHRTNSPKPKEKERPEPPKPEKGTQDVPISKAGTESSSAEAKTGNAVNSTTKNSATDVGASQKLRLATNDKTKELTGAGNMVTTVKLSDDNKHSPSESKASAPLGKLDISSATTPQVKSGVLLSKPDPQSPTLNIVETPIAMESIPNTPTANNTKPPELTTASRPRTLRLTTGTIQKAETTPASATTERSSALSAALLKQTSRQPSISSISRSRPSTPAMSEHGMSTEISRAGSPPASDTIGSATERKKSKSQAKKDRKAKSKMNNESRDDESVVSTPPVLEEVGPIISRQKKKKKTQEKANSTTAQSSREATVEPEAVISGQTEKTVKAEAGKATKDANSVSSRDQPTQNTEKSKTKAGHTRSKSEQKTTPAAAGAKDDQPKSDPAPPKSYTLNDLLNDAAKLPDTEEALFELLNASISATSELLRQLIESKELDLNNALFNAPPLNSYKLPPDSRKGADYLDSNGYTMNSPFGEVYVSTQDRKQLLQGREVRLSDPNKPQNVLKRTMITPRGRIYRHLSTAEEERVLELEKRMQENEEKFGTTGKIDLKPLDDTDFMNLTGGLQELMAFPPLHRISLLTAEPGTEGTAADEDDPANLAAADNNSDETEDDEMAPLASGFGGAGPPEVVGPGGPIPLMNSGRKPMTPNTMKRKADALMGGAAAVNLRNLDVDKLAKRIRETQVEMEGARKEMEALEKKASRKAKDVSRWKEALVREFGKGF